MSFNRDFNIEDFNLLKRLPSDERKASSFRWRM